MARKEGLRPIGDSIKKIIEKIQKERQERQKKGKPIRTQPKLPGLKKGGDVQKMMSGGFGIFSKKKAKADEPDKKESNEVKKKKRLEELKKEIDGMKQGGSAKKPIKVNVMPPILKYPFFFINENAMPCISLPKVKIIPHA